MAHRDFANLTGVEASQENSRITAGALNNPIIYERAAGGVAVNQLITDFGRTTNLAASANFAAKAENQNAMATRSRFFWPWIKLSMAHCRRTRF